METRGELTPNQNGSEILSFELTEEQRAALPSNIRYWLAWLELDNASSHKPHESFEKIIEAIEAKTGLDETAQQQARRYMIGEREIDRGFTVEKDETGVRFVLTPVGKKKITAQIHHIQKEISNTEPA